MIEYLSTKEGVELVASHMDQALHQLETGEKKLRFRSVMPKEELREELDNLLIEKQIFPTADHVEIKREDFITQDEIDHNLGRGSGYSHGSFRIYDYFQEKHDSKEAAEFLKKEYDTMRKTINEKAWDGEWYMRALSKKENICLLYTSPSPRDTR